MSVYKIIWLAYAIASVSGALFCEEQRFSGGTDLPHREHLAMSGDIFDCDDLGGWG